MDTGEVREIAPNPIVNLYFGARWFHDGRSLVAAGTDGKGRWGVFRIDAQNGHTSAIFVLDPTQGSTALAAPSPDGSAVFYRRHRPGREGFLFIKRDLASGRETELMHRPGLNGLDVSPDGRFIATPSADRSPNPNTVLLIPTDGGEARELARVAAPGRANVFGWAADSSSVFLWRNPSGTQRELWRAFLDGRDAI